MRVINRTNKSGREAARLLGKHLDDRFTLVHRVRLPNRRNPVDAVLIGPQGVTVLAIANDIGRVRCLGDNWYAWGPTRKFLATRHNPVKQAQNDRQAIEMFLAGRQWGSLIPVDCAVLVPQSDAQVEFMQPVIPIVPAGKIADMATRLAGQRELIEWTQAGDVEKSLGVQPLGKPWRLLGQPGTRPQARRGSRVLGLKRNQLILLTVIAVADVLMLVGGLIVVVLMR